MLGALDFYAEGFAAGKSWLDGFRDGISGGGVGPPIPEIPSMQTGGVVPYSGLYLLHAGEHVSPGAKPPGPPIKGDGTVGFGEPDFPYGGVPSEEEQVVVEETTVIPVTMQFMQPVTIRRKKDIIDFAAALRRELQNPSIQRIIGQIANEQVGEEQKKRDRLQGGF